MIDKKYEQLITVTKILGKIEEDSLCIKSSDKVILIAKISRLAIQLGNLFKSIIYYEEDPENTGIAVVIDDYFTEIEPIVSKYGQEEIYGLAENMSEYNLAKNALNLSIFTESLREELKDLWYDLWIQHVDYELDMSVYNLSIDLMVKGKRKKYKFNK